MPPELSDMPPDVLEPFLELILKHGTEAPNLEQLRMKDPELLERVELAMMKHQNRRGKKKRRRKK